MVDPILYLKARILSMGLILSEKLDFAIVGFPKCATTSIQRNLLLSDSVRMQNHEVQLKTLMRVRNNREDLQLLNGVKNPNLLFEMHNLKALLIANPDLKLIIGLRNPVDWLYSFYRYRQQEIATGKLWIRKEVKKKPFLKKISFDDVVFRDAEIVNASKEHGKYFNYLSAVSRHVDPQNVFIYFVEELAYSPDDVYLRLFSFLGLDYIENKGAIHANRNPIAFDSRQQSKAQLDYLRNYYGPWNVRLNQLLRDRWDIDNIWW